jgi:hypothetical protein
MRELLQIAGRRPVPERADDAIVLAPTMPVADGDGNDSGNGNGNGNGAAPVTSDDLRSLLALAGSRPVPEPDPDFLAETEARILGLDRKERGAAAVPLDDDPLDELSVRRGRRLRRPALLTGAAAAVVVLVIVGALTGLYGGGGGDGSAGGGLALVTAIDTVVVLPDGTIVDGARGLELPDGTIIRTGPRGRATIAGVLLGPDTKAVVRNGRVRVVGGGETSESPAGRGTGTDVVPPPAPTDGGTGGSTGGSGGSTSGSGSTSGGGSGSETPTSAPPPPPTLLPPIIVPELPLSTLPPLNELLPLS